MHKSPPVPNFALISSTNDNPAPTVVIPVNFTLPPGDIVPPTPPAPISIPPCSITPTESTLVTSSYVRTPVNVAATPVTFLTVISGVPVNPPAVPEALPVTLPTKLDAVITPDTASIPVELIVTAAPTVVTPITLS